MVGVLVVLIVGLLFTSIGGFPTKAPSQLVASAATWRGFFFVRGFRRLRRGVLHQFQQRSQGWTAVLESRCGAYPNEHGQNYHSDHWLSNIIVDCS